MWPLQTPQATSRDTAPTTMSAMGLSEELDLLAMSEDSRALRIAKPAATLMVMPPAGKAISIRSGFGLVKIRITPASNVG